MCTYLAPASPVTFVSLYADAVFIHASALYSFSCICFILHPTHSHPSLYYQHIIQWKVFKHSFIELMSAFDVPLFLFHTPKFPLDLSLARAYTLFMDRQANNLLTFKT